LLDSAIQHSACGHCSRASGHPVHSTDNKITSTWQHLLQGATHLSSGTQC